MVMAYIYVLLGEYDAALDEIELLLSIPSHTSMAWFQADPIWAPVWEHPRFQNLISQGSNSHQ